MDMFEHKSKEQMKQEAPLAARMRPATFNEFVGQEHLRGEGRVLRKVIEAMNLIYEQDGFLLVEFAAFLSLSYYPA